MKVGIFDSGLGGLTVLKSILEIFRNVEIFYIADTSFAPYGEKNIEEIQQRCKKITKYFLEKHNIDALIIACNTATSASIKILRQKFPKLIIIGTEPGIKPAIYSTKTLNIGILATSLTLKSDKYQLLVNELSSLKKVNLFEQACNGLANQIEQGQINTESTYAMLKNWLEPMKKENVDTIVLGCTHYPLISHVIKNIMGDNVILIETGNAIANRLLELSQYKNNNFDDLKLNILHTGQVNSNMIKFILGNVKYELMECEI